MQTVRQRQQRAATPANLQPQRRRLYASRSPERGARVNNDVVCDAAAERYTLLLIRYAEMSTFSPADNNSYAVIAVTIDIAIIFLIVFVTASPLFLHFPDIIVTT
jgi:hypothetical protein